MSSRGWTESTLFRLFWVFSKDLSFQREETFWFALVFKVSLHWSRRLADVQLHQWFSEKVYLTQGVVLGNPLFTEPHTLFWFFAGYYFSKLICSCPSVWFLHWTKFYFILKQKYLLNWHFYFFSDKHTFFYIYYGEFKYL